eukprot:TRINITY_DN5453_c0_g2_i1.p1 TRINITY_DN5453_c0_g2~~TRINITY_DN5453_c0_g2_i1.p1  ORF type:complete len:164 (-),score=46.99 TRINITY_DN5453_c0_g2_i1:35-466(-)
MNRMTVDEDAETLSFGADFEKSRPLLMSEVALVMQTKTGPKNDLTTVGDIFTKTLEYTQRFSRLKRKAEITEARAILEKYKDLHPFEAVQIANLAITSGMDEEGNIGEEAYELIPSLVSKVDETTIGELLQELDSLYYDISSK